MTVFEGSRYEFVPETLEQGADGKPRTVLAVSAATTVSFSYILYTVREGERIDQIAARFFGDPEKWWVIANANPTRAYWDTLTTGAVLRIPSG